MEWWPLSRDCLIYSIAIAAMTIMMWDGVIGITESTILIVLYFVYFIILFCDKQLSRWAHKIVRIFSKPKTLEGIYITFVVSRIWELDIAKKAKLTSVNSIPETTNKNASPEEHDAMGIYRPYFHGELIIEYRHSVTNSISKRPSEENPVKNVILDEPVDEYVPPGRHVVSFVFQFLNCIIDWKKKKNFSLNELLIVSISGTPFTIPKGISIYQKLWWWFLWPLRFVLFITVPDCRFKKVKKFYPFTFVMCIFWIAVTSYFVSWMITVVGDTIGIADAVMGLTFLAAGGSLPEAVSSVIMARQGQFIFLRPINIPTIYSVSQKCLVQCLQIDSPIIYGQKCQFVNNFETS